MYWYIYIGVPLRNPREGDCVGDDSLTARGGGAKETLKLWMPTRVEPLMGQAKPHVGGGPEPMYLCYSTFSNPTAVETLATTNIETGPKI
jgi:hypothetical protein